VLRLGEIRGVGRTRRDAFHSAGLGRRLFADDALGPAAGDPLSES
jgi:hypothetical protein